DVPVAIYQDGENASLRTYRFTAPSEPSIGDVRLALDLRLFGKHGEAITAALGGQVFLPTGSTDQYVGDGSPRIVPRLSFAGDVGLFTYAARGGVLVRTSDPTIAGQTRGPSIVFGAAAGLRVANKKLVVGPELYGSASL